ncbi:hypothetical protein JS562_37560 [Agrobacterium sp. S2]|nr:hypothetical protein [Agrobacterium sp. S2]
MSNTQYVEYKDRHDWQDTTVALVDVFPGDQAFVRSFIPRYVSKELSLAHALQHAKEFATIDAHIRSVAIFLEEGAVWDDRYGTLIPWSSRPVG